MAASHRILLSEHARAQAARRDIPTDVVMSIAESPEQRLALRDDREIRQSRVGMGVGGKLYLVRVIVDVGHVQDEIVTVYRTSKITKYWSGK